MGGGERGKGAAGAGRTLPKKQIIAKSAIKAYKNMSCEWSSSSSSFSSFSSFPAAAAVPRTLAMSVGNAVGAGAGTVGTENTVGIGAVGIGVSVGSNVGTDDESSRSLLRHLLAPLPLSSPLGAATCKPSTTALLPSALSS